MTPLTLQLAFTPWTLATDDGAVAVTARETCINDQCAPTGSPSERFGVWRVGDLQIRWTFNDEAIVRIGAGPWRPAHLTGTTPAVKPPDSLEVAPIEAGGWAPGLWREATIDCDRARPVWVFDSILREGTELVAIPGPRETWTLRPGASIHMCHDEKGQFGGIG